MPVQIKAGRPKEQHDGLHDIESKILAAPNGEQIVAVVTFVREKIVTDEKLDDTYPVLGIKHIEPILDSADLEVVVTAQLAAYKKRTGESELDFSGIDSEPPAAEVVGDEVATSAKAAKK